MEGRTNFVETEPSVADEPTSSAAVPPIIDPDRYARIRSYFERKYDKQAARWEAFRFSVKRLKYIFGVIAAIALLAAVAGAATQYLGYSWLVGFEVYELAIGFTALAVVLIVVLLPAADELPSTAAVEQEIDASRRNDIENLLSRATKLLGTTQSDSNLFDEVLIGYPDAEACKARHVLVSARLGHDEKVRFTPIKITALTLMDRTAAVYESTLDVTTGAMLSERLLELPYQSIALLERSSQTMGQSDRRAQKVVLGSVKKQSGGHLHRDKDTLKIHLSNSAGVQVVLRDYDFDANLNTPKLPLSSAQEDVERFWRRLGQKWAEAQKQIET